MSAVPRLRRIAIRVPNTSPPNLKSTRHRRYLLCMLSIALAFNSTDRMTLGLLLQSIKNSLHLTDLQLGILNGIAFAFFYSVMGVPIGVLADRGNRIRIVAVTTALWGVMVSLSAATMSFVQLLLVRIGVAVGESGCVPPSHSLLAEYFERESRARATAIFYALGFLLSNAIGYLFAGWINQRVGWRITFVAIGLPGLVLAVVIWVSLKDPRADSREPSRAVASLNRFARSSPYLPRAITTACRSLWHIKTYRHLLFSFAIVSFFGYGLVQWQPSFYIRSYGFDTATLGEWFAVIYGITGTVGTFLGGEIASRFAGGNERLQLACIAVIYAAFGAISVGIYLVPSYAASFALLALACAFGALAGGPLFACIQTVVPPESRAVSISLLYLAGNLIGMGLGPLAVGTLSQVLLPVVGRESLRYALAAMSPGYLIGSWYFWRSSRTISGDIRALARSCSLPSGGT